MKTGTLIIFTLAAALASGPACATGQVPTSQPLLGLTVEEQMRILRGLPELPKVHYCWGFTGHASEWEGRPIIPLSDPRLPEYVRICHGIGLAGTIPPKYARQAVKLCADVNRSKPKIPATIALNYSLWHYKFPPRPAPPTDPDPGEIALFESRMRALKAEINRANAGLGSDVKVGAILFDCERWTYKASSEAGAAEWNAAINAKFNAGYEAAKKLFPGVPVDWAYLGTAPRSSDWTKIKHDSYSGGQYCPGDFRVQTYNFRRLISQAVADGQDRVLVWLSAGATGTLDPKPGNPWYARWTPQQDYDSANSWEMGRLLNSRTYPGHGEHWERVTAVIWFPQPWHCPHWFKHFVMYCRGAAWHRLEAER
ncbi:MAG: hypothetical protein QUV05_11310 [Phycisphaerae bacterium]|nr:hypothetical protein [Phycisphaerae bacterium]